RAHAGGYEVLSWVGFTPEELREDMAEVMGHMATDVPSGELELEPEQWTAGRVADTERVVDRTGRTRVTTVARHRDSGRLVAYTIIDHPRDKPAVGYQEDTLVVREHRGHRLGMLVKAANLRTLAEHLPHVRRIHTWNAGENAQMLAINHALGFRDVSLEGGWQVTGLDRRPAGDPSRAAADGTTLEVCRPTGSRSPPSPPPWRWPGAARCRRSPSRSRWVRRPRRRPTPATRAPRGPRPRPTCPRRRQRPPPGTGRSAPRAGRGRRRPSTRRPSTRPR